MSIKEIDDSYQRTSLFDISDFKAEEAKTAIKQPKKAMNDVPQSSLFSFAYPSFKFAKPVRLIELFAGYGSQMMAMERLREEGFFPLGFETWRICEWAIPSFIAWAKIHAKDDRNDYSASFDKDALVKILSERGSSLDWKAPAGTEKLKRKPEEYLRMAYNAMVASRNVVDITRAKASDFAMENRDKYDVVLTWSFPCQSLSLAGKRAGMDEGSGSESSLGYEVLRLLDEMKEIGQLPTVLVMENVPQFASSSNHENIMKIQDRLGKLGYKSYVQIQSATDFGIPQTRRRCFMISVLGDYSYAFPTGFPLTLKLKDKLEENVSDKYYLSRKIMRYVLAKPTKNYGTGLKEIVNPSIARTVNTNYGRYRAGIDTYVSPDCEEDADLTCAIGGLPIKDSSQNGFHTAIEGDGISINRSNKHHNNITKQISHSITTVQDQGAVVSKPICINPKVNGRQPKIENRVYDPEGTATALTTSFPTKYAVSVGIDKSSNDPRQIDIANCITTREDRGISHRKSEGTAVIEIGSYTPSGMSGKVVDPAGMSPTLTTGNHGNVTGLIEVGNIYPESGNPQAGRIYDKDGLSPALDTMSGGNRQPKIITSDSVCLNPKGGRGGIDGLQPSLENRVYDPDGCAVALATGFQPKYAIGADGRIDLSAVYVTDEADPRFLVWDGKEWRELEIRRLTPRECFRLQDVSDFDFDLIKDLFSESTLYHLAGDSICVANIYFDFKEMCVRQEKLALKIPRGVVKDGNHD